MRALIVVENGAIAPPPDQLPMLIQAFKAWRNKWRDKMEAFEFFAGRGGGWGVFNTSDETEFSQAMMEFPLNPFSTVAVHPTVDGDDALNRLGETINAMLSEMQKGQ